jgi:hypothetical protein
LLSPFLLALTALCPSCSAQRNPLDPVRSSQKDASGLTILESSLHFAICRHEFPKIAGYLVIKSGWYSSPFDVTESAAEITLTYDGRRLEIKRNLGERLTSPDESRASAQYALQSQAMRSNLSTHNLGGSIE